MISEDYYRYRGKDCSDDTIKEEKNCNAKCVTLLAELIKKRSFTHYSKSGHGEVTWYFTLSRYYGYSCNLAVTVQYEKEVVSWSLVSASQHDTNSMKQSVLSRELLNTPNIGINIVALMLILKGMSV